MLLISYVTLVHTLAFSAWNVNEIKDEMTGSIETYANSPEAGPTRPMSTPYDDIRGWLGVGCNNEREWVYVGFTDTPNIHDKEISEGHHIINTKMKWGEKIENIVLGQKPGSTFLHLLRHHKNDNTHINNLLNSNEALLELDWFGQGKVYFRFDLSGSSGVISSIRKSCKNDSVNLLIAAQNYYSDGQQKIKEGKWLNARMAFERAWKNADIENADDSKTAIYAYEYGRASGAICDWPESEKGLLKAIELDKKTKGPIHMSFVEIARMYNAKGNLIESDKYFSLAKERLDEIQADTLDPIGYADFLRTYSEVLIKLERKSEADDLINREQEIRNMFKGKKSDHETTPYGEHCDQKS